VSEWGATATYNAAGRPVALAGNAIAHYVYNAFSQRILKVTSLGTVVFVYDEIGHLLGEYDGSGNLIEETIWLGEIPVATLQPSGSGNGVNIFYVHSDHLNTPRKVSRPSDNQVVWRWDLDPFENQQPDDDPAGLGQFTYNLRYAGQYFDSESGYHYNYNRYYDPLSGGYAQSDPIGLKGGINTYAYAHDTPLSLTDPSGLAATTVSVWCVPVFGRAVHCAVIARCSLTGESVRLELGGPDGASNWERLTGGLIPPKVPISNPPATPGQKRRHIP
jgi:RHS repeat-associated protein